MRTLAARLVRVRPVLRGLQLEPMGNGYLHMSMRVAGHTRWEIQRDARKLVVLFLRKAFILATDVQLELVTTERNASDLYLGEGRTPMARRPRAALKADGTPWDHYLWWGDELPPLEDLGPNPATGEANPRSPVPPAG
jgi:hypothetical protein